MLLKSVNPLGLHCPFVLCNAAAEEPHPKLEALFQQGLAIGVQNFAYKSLRMSP